ncbi:MAG: hypothetical protein N4A74_22600, partial [Carboxylicivirga sp.]|nr:hypothetical protein [Carboxylicivirga sp.]
AFITAEGWGTYSQKRENDQQKNSLDMAYGRLRLNNVELDVLSDKKVKTVKVLLNGNELNSAFKQNGLSINVRLSELVLNEGDKLELQIN